MKLSAAAEYPLVNVATARFVAARLLQPYRYFSNTVKNNATGSLLLCLAKQFSGAIRRRRVIGLRQRSSNCGSSSFFRKSIVVFLFFIGCGGVAFAQQNIPLPFFNFDIREAQNSSEVSLSLQILLLLSVLALVPSILIMMTSFVRIAIILKFVQRALSLQQEPPNQVIMGLALFITFFVMAPTITTLYEEGYKPYVSQEISTDDFFSLSANTMKSFMLKQTREKDIDLFLYLSNAERPATPNDVSLVTLIPAFLISEITIAFQIGVYLFIPFIVIDMIVASILMSMGMILIPPVMISLPFKIILFVLVDGWHLITLQTIRSFNF